MWGSIQFSPDATAELFVVLADVNHLTFGALRNQVPPHTGDIFESVTCEKVMNKVIKHCTHFTVTHVTITKGL